MTMEKHSLRLLMVSTSYPLQPDSVSGIFVRRLVDALSPAVEPTVLTLASTDPDGGSYAPYPVIALRYAPRRWCTVAHRPGGIPAALKRSRFNGVLVIAMFCRLFLATLFRARRHHVIHANWSLTGLVCALAGRMVGVPTVVTLRGSDVSGLSGSSIKRAVCAAVLTLARKTVTVSEAMRNELVTRFPQHEARIDCIPNGVLPALLELPIQTPPPPLRLLFAGNLIRGKGVFELIDAFRPIDTALTLTIAGDGPEREALQHQVRQLGLADRVRFTGSVAPDAMPELFSQHDVLVLPSHAEGRPNVVVEAMAAGRAVIATDLPGIAELIDTGRHGLLVPAGDVEALREALQQLLSDPPRCAELGGAARERVQTLGLDWHHCAQRYVALYTHLHGARA